MLEITFLKMHYQYSGIQECSNDILIKINTDSINISE